MRGKHSTELGRVLALNHNRARSHRCIGVPHTIRMEGLHAEFDLLNDASYKAGLAVHVPSVFGAAAAAILGDVFADVRAVKRARAEPVAVVHAPLTADTLTCVQEFFMLNRCCRSSCIVFFLDVVKVLEWERTADAHGQQQQPSEPRWGQPTATLFAAVREWWATHDVTPSLHEGNGDAVYMTPAHSAIALWAVTLHLQGFLSDEATAVKCALRLLESAVHREACYFESLAHAMQVQPKVVLRSLYSLCLAQRGPHGLPVPMYDTCHKLYVEHWHETRLFKPKDKKLPRVDKVSGWSFRTSQITKPVLVATLELLCSFYPGVVHGALVSVVAMFEAALAKSAVTRNE